MKELLNLAKEDLETAQLLYNNKKYSFALYHFHQCVEKAVKHIGLSIGGISEAQLTKISHDPIKVFKLLFKFFDLKSNGLNLPIDPHLIANATQKINFGSEEEIVNNAWDMLKNTINEGKIIYEEQFPSPFDAVCDYINKAHPEVNLDLGIDNDTLKNQVAVLLEKDAINTIIRINYGTKILQILLINSLICSKFKPDECRYPSDKLGNPVEYFDENNALIKELPFFISTMNIPIEFAEKINW